MDLNLKGKRAYVCGSTQGIGKSVAIELANLGASVTLIARNEASLVEVRNMLFKTSGQSHDYIVADFDNPSGLKVSLENYLSKNKEAHILINNTGGPAGGKAIDANVEEYIQAFSNHLLCNQIITQALVPFMKEAHYGRIINIISTSVKAPIPGLGVSNTIRGAVANWAKTLSLELGSFGITVNNVLPGATTTQRLDSIITNKSVKERKEKEAIEEEMKKEIPAGRFAGPEEVAYAVAFLATPSASYINGINIPVDGGRTPNL
jgi:3-oxoacyl-[acyl-carrier protein] reductase